MNLILMTELVRLFVPHRSGKTAAATPGGAPAASSSKTSAMTASNQVHRPPIERLGDSESIN